MTAYTSLDQARVERAALKDAARRASLEWQDSVIASIELAVAHAGVSGPDALVMFAGTDAQEPDVGAVEWEQRDELTSTVFAARGRLVGLSVTQGPRWLWEETVALWDELRSVLAQVYGVEVPAGIVVDVDRRVVYCFEPWFCPEIGAEPDAIFELDRADAAPLDPFEDLLKAAAVDVDALDARLDYLLELHQVSAPTRPGHEPGDCGLADLDDFGDLGDLGDLG